MIADTDEELHATSNTLERRSDICKSKRCAADTLDRVRCHGQTTGELGSPHDAEQWLWGLIKIFRK